MRDCHSRDPSSILGYCILLFFLLIEVLVFQATEYRPSSTNEKQKKNPQGRFLIMGKRKSVCSSLTNILSSRITYGNLRLGFLLGSFLYEGGGSVLCIFNFHLMSTDRLVDARYDRGAPFFFLILPLDLGA